MRLSMPVSRADPELLRHAWADRDYVAFTGSTTLAHVVARDRRARRAMVVMTSSGPTGAFAHPELKPPRQPSNPGGIGCQK